MSISWKSKKFFEQNYPETACRTILMGLAGIRCQSLLYKPQRFRNLKAASTDPGSEEKRPGLVWPPGTAEVSEECQSLCAFASPNVTELGTTVLSSFPGSGSKWLLTMLQFASGYITNVE